MSNILYKIRDLVCAYDRNHPVLQIDSLDLVKGKQTVFVGKSGAGKSTILETLGLMNRTIVEGEILFYPDDENGIDLASLWNNEERLAEFRNRYYSFIFQNTNLMNNFSAFENACIPQLLQGISMDIASERVREAMLRVGLKNISLHDKVTHLAGGQRQRLAFVRAMTPDFAVLFGDEPTGNLDVRNSRELMQFIDDDIHKNNRSAILVSHNIELSLEFADQIVLLVKPEQDPIGRVTMENIFVSHQNGDVKEWSDLDGNRLQDIRQVLIEKLI